ncbi:MAG: ATP-binding protein [Desulfoferrobacter sp.]
MSLNDKPPASLAAAKKSRISKTDYKEAFEKADSILQTVREALIVLDADLRVVSVNDSFYKTFQTTVEETLGLPVYEIGNGQWDIPELRGLLTNILSQGATIEDFLVEHDFPLIGRKVMLLNARKIQKTNDEGLDLILLAMEDVTGRKQLEDELKELHEKLAAKVVELENVNEELSQFAYVTSHDLKAPLRAIHNYADFLREDLEEILVSEQLEYLNGLTLAVKQGEALIDDLLAFSRIGRSKQSIEEVDLGAVLRDMKTTLESTEKVEITISDDWPVIEGEKSLLTQIFRNLLSNAVKFNQSNQKRIELGWKFAEQGFVELYVRDNGIGIDSRYHGQIFRIFQRLHNREEFEGTGIGLAIARKAVGLMGGSILVQSQPGVGSTFFVTLPTKSPGV